MSHRKSLLFIGIWCVLLLVLFRSLIGSGLMLGGDDAISSYYFFFNLFHRGDSRWLSSIFGGLDYVSLNIPAAYPPILLFKVLPPAAALGLTTALHYLLAAWGMYRWCRILGCHRLSALCGSLMYAFCPFAVGFAHQWLFVYVLGLLPWLLWAYERLLRRPDMPRLLVLALTGGLILQQLHPQLLFFFAVGFLVYALVRAFQEAGQNTRSMRSLVASLLMAFGLALVIGLPQILSASQMQQATSRGAGLDIHAAMFGSLPPEELFGFYMPAAFGDWSNLKDFFPKLNPFSPYYWGRMELRLNPDHVGIVVILLSLVALLAGTRRKLVWLFGTLVVLMITLGLGKHFITYPLLYLAVPGLDLFRVPYRFLMVGFIFMVPLAAMGVDSLLDADRERVRKALARAGVVFVILLALPAIFLVFVNLSPPFDPYRIANPVLWPQLQAMSAAYQGFDQVNTWWILCLGYAGLFGTLFLLVSWKQVTSPSRTLPGGWIRLLPVLIVLEIFPVSMLYIRPVSTSSAWFAETKTMAYLKDRQNVDGPSRYHNMTGISQMLPNANVLYGVDNILGYQATIPKEYNDLVERLSGNNSIINLLNTRHLVVPLGARPGGGDLTPVFNDPDRGLSVLANPKAFPRAYVAHDYVVEPSRLQRLRFIQDPRLDLRNRVILEKPASFAPVTQPPAGRPAASESAPRITYGPDRVEIQVTAARQGLLVLLDNHFRGWSATVNGQPAEILRANHAFRAVEVPAGASTVVMTYSNRPVEVALLISRILMFLCLAIPVAAAIIGNRKA